MPPGRSARSECFQVASPTVSSTASTRSGSRAPVSNAASRAELLGRRALRLVAARRPHAQPGMAAERDRRRRHAAAGALDEHGLPGLRARPSRTASGTRSATPSAGTPPPRRRATRASGTRLARGTATRSASAPWCSSESSVRFGSSVSSPRQSGVAITEWTIDLRAVLVDARGVAAEDHRQPVVGQSDAAQRPQVVVVERGGADLHRRPARRAPRARGALRPRARTADRRSSCG